MQFQYWIAKVVVKERRERRSYPTHHDGLRLATRDNKSSNKNIIAGLDPQTRRNVSQPCWWGRCRDWRGRRHGSAKFESTDVRHITTPIHSAGIVERSRRTALVDGQRRVRCVDRRAPRQERVGQRRTAVVSQRAQLWITGPVGRGRKTSRPGLVPNEVKSL